MASRLGPREVKRRLAASDRQGRVVDLFVQGWSYRQIAAELGYAGPSSVKKAIDGAIAKVPSRAVGELRKEIDERSRALLAQLHPIAFGKRTQADVRLAAIDRIIKVDRELRAMHGVDAPSATVHLLSEVPVKDVRQELLDRLTRLAEASSAGEGDPEPDG